MIPQEEVKNIIIVQLGVDEKQVIPVASFVEDFQADSLDKEKFMRFVE